MQWRQQTRVAFGLQYDLLFYLIELAVEGFTDYGHFMQTGPLMSKSDKKKAVNLNVKEFENDVAFLKLCLSR